MGTAAFQWLLALDGWQAVAILAKAATYAAAFAASGGVMFLAACVDELTQDEVQRLRGRVVVLAGLALALSLLRIAVINGTMADQLAGMLDLTLTRAVLASREGAATVLRMVALLALLVLSRHPLDGARGPAALLAALCAAASFAIVGHASEVELAPGWRRLPQLLLALHLAAIAFWLGALGPLRRLAGGADCARIARVMERFGRLAGGVVAALLATGASVLWWLIGTPDQLGSSDYGRLFLLKLTGVALLLALATFNRWRLVPRLHAGDHAALPALRRSIDAERVLAGLILLVTATLTSALGPGM
jgi:putative copper export protein